MDGGGGGGGGCQRTLEVKQNEAFTWPQLGENGPAPSISIPISKMALPRK